MSGEHRGRRAEHRTTTTGNATSVMALLCPCFAGSKESTTDHEENSNSPQPPQIIDGEHHQQKSPFLANQKKEQIPSEEDHRNNISSSARCIIRKISSVRRGGDGDRASSSLAPKNNNNNGGSKLHSKRKLLLEDQKGGMFEFDRHSNASASLHQIPSLCKDSAAPDLAESGGGGWPSNKADKADLCSQSGSKYACGRSMTSRYSVDDAGSYRSTLRVDRTPSLSFCSEAGVAKSSSILVNIPSSRGSLSSLGRCSSSRRSPSPQGTRKGSLTLSSAADANSSLYRQHITRTDVQNSAKYLYASPSTSARNINQPANE